MKLEKYNLKYADGTSIGPVVTIESLIPRLQEALSKTADSSKIVAVKRILRELNGNK